MGSTNADKARNGRALLFSTSGYALGLANGQLFGCPPAPDALPVSAISVGETSDVPGEQGTQLRREEDSHDA